jgi:hypothetical protein
MRIQNLLFFLVVLVFLASCGSSPGETTPEFVMPTPRPPVTLAPTYTPPATQGPLPTITPPPTRETAVPDTPIPFDETVLELRYQIPLLGLNRRLQGNVANQLILVDEVNGRSIQRNNEGGVMFELRQALLDVELAAVPESCPGCVYVEYELLDADLSDSGWLQDPVLLASIENFMSATLGPHFPEGTAIGLRRSASPYAPGHNIAVAEDGRLWMWLATEAEVGPAISSEITPLLLAELAQISAADLNEAYQADCRGVPIETLQLNLADETWSGRLVCPELTLPTTLQPLYVQLDSLLAEKTADATVEKPDTVFPVAGLLRYTRADDAQLTLYPNSTLISVDPFGAVYTNTLTSTLPISLTTSLFDTGLLQPGFSTFVVEEASPITTTVTAEPPTSTLAVRGANGVYDAEWLELPDFDVIRFLDTLLNRTLLLGGSDDLSEPETTPEPTDENLATSTAEP